MCVCVCVLVDGDGGIKCWCEGLLLTLEMCFTFHDALRIIPSF